MNYEEMLKKAKANLPSRDAVTRFEIPEPQTSMSGRQTMIKNFGDIAKTIRRDPKHFAKYLFKELAVPGDMRGNELVLQSKIGFMMIKKRIDSYVSEFVICEECGKPDTQMTKDGKNYFMKCEACGARKSLRSI
jgi:translation initiation factor 2 subunit 2